MFAWDHRGSWIHRLHVVVGSTQILDPCSSFVAGSCGIMDPAHLFPVGSNGIIDPNYQTCEIHPDHRSSIRIHPHVWLQEKKAKPSIALPSTPTSRHKIVKVNAGNVTSGIEDNSLILKIFIIYHSYACTIAYRPPDSSLGRDVSWTDW